MPDERWIELFAALRSQPGPRGAGVGDQHRRPGRGAARAARRGRGLGRSARPGQPQGHAAPRSGCRAAPRRSCGCGSGWPSSANPAPGRSGLADAAPPPRPRARAAASAADLRGVAGGVAAGERRAGHQLDRCTTCAIPARCGCCRDETLTLRDVQTILGHAQLTHHPGLSGRATTPRSSRRVHRYLAERAQRPRTPRRRAAGYDGDDLAVLLGAGAR